MRGGGSDPLNRRVRTTLAACVAVVGVMVALAYAASPLYRLFCKVTGYGGTTQTATGDAAEVIDRVMTIRFDSNVANGLDWKFRPEAATLPVRVGATATVFFHVENRSASETAGVATYNVQPDLAGSYFDKLQCFCFSELHLKPGESLDVPVVFYVDPAIMKEHDLDRLEEITLSYTFFPAKANKSPLAELTGQTKPQL